MGQNGVLPEDCLMANTPFETIESAQEYLRLLALQLDGVRGDIEEDTQEAIRARAARRVDALRIIDYKLKQLSQHLAVCSRILNDLRMLRRILVDRDTAPLVAEQVEAAAAEPPRL